MGLLVAIGHVTTTRTRVPYVVATIGNHLWLGQVGNRGHTFSGIGSIRTRTKHGFALLVPMVEPQGYDKGSSGAILKPGKDAIVSYFTRFFRLPNEHWVGSGRVTLWHVSPIPPLDPCV